MDFLEDKLFKPGFCLRCNGAVWEGRVVGFDVVADPAPVDLQTEVLCYYAKRRTFGVYRRGHSFYLHLRYLATYERQYELVLAAHVCFSPQSAREHPDYWPTTRYQIPDQPNF